MVRSRPATPTKSRTEMFGFFVLYYFKRSIALSSLPAKGRKNVRRQYNRITDCPLTFKLNFALKGSLKSNNKNTAHAAAAFQFNIPPHCICKFFANA